jgi:GNAT superfamily N-acetyltransferase
VTLERLTVASAAECTALHAALFGRPFRYRSLGGYEDARPGYAARVAGDVVGFVSAVEWTPDIIEIDNLLVHPAWQGQGWGSALTTRLIAECRDRYRAVISTNSDLHEPGGSGKRDAAAFYERHGFRVVAATERTRVFWRDL